MIKNLWEELQRNPTMVPLQDYERRKARLAGIIDGFMRDGCPLEEDCKHPGEHLAEEILSRYHAWV